MVKGHDPVLKSPTNPDPSCLSTRVLLSKAWGSSSASVSKHTITPRTWQGRVTSPPQPVPSAVDLSQTSPTTRHKSVLRVRIMVSGSSLHIKVGAGRRERTGKVEAARGNLDPTSGPTVAPGTRALAVVSTSWFAAALRFAPARAKSWVFACYREGSALRERGTELGSRGSSSEDAQPWPGLERTALHPNAEVLCSPRALGAAPSHCARPHGRDPRCGFGL